jgi:hypothetical protein
MNGINENKMMSLGEFCFRCRNIGIASASEMLMFENYWNNNMNPSYIELYENQWMHELKRFRLNLLVERQNLKERKKEETKIRRKKQKIKRKKQEESFLNEMIYWN